MKTNDIRPEITDFMVERLENFKKQKNGFPAMVGSEEMWEELIDNMIAAFKMLKEKEGKKDYDVIEKGLLTFAYYADYLWG